MSSPLTSIQPPSVPSFDRVYVGGFPTGTTEDGLRLAFEVVGVHVGLIEMILDRATGAPRKFAFVDLEHRMEARDDAALAEALGEVSMEGQPLRIRGVPLRSCWNQLVEDE